MKSLTIAFAIIALILLAVIAGRQLTTPKVKLPKGQTTTESITRETTRKVFVTDNTRHTIPLNEIIGGGPPKDGIPSIDDPKFVSVKNAESFLADAEPGIAVSHEEIDRFYPYQILVWHEIVNDAYNGKRVLVTYCPLCLSGIVFDPVVQGERVEFGVSGKLWENNLLMYDRMTDSLWSQILGEAVLGEAVPAALPIIPSDITMFGNWKKVHPNGEVLSQDTGATRFYGTDPYGSYYTEPGTLFPSRGTADTRLDQKDFILGIVINGSAKAYYPPTIKAVGQVEDVFEGVTIVAQYEEELDAVRLFRKNPDGSLERINPFPSFWFSWVAAHPKTALYK